MSNDTFPGMEAAAALEAATAMASLVQMIERIEQHLSFQTTALVQLVGGVQVGADGEQVSIPGIANEQLFVLRQLAVTLDTAGEQLSKFGGGPLSLLSGKKKDDNNGN